MSSPLQDALRIAAVGFGNGRRWLFEFLGLEADNAVDLIHREGHAAAFPIHNQQPLEWGALRFACQCLGQSQQSAWGDTDKQLAAHIY